MTTFLEYACSLLLGPPLSSSGDGESMWPCPRCDARKFHTRPPDPHFKDKFACYRCSWWGDLFDLMAERGVGRNYPDRKSIVATWKRTYERRAANATQSGGALEGSGAVGMHPQPPAGGWEGSSFPPGTSGTENPRRRRQRFMECEAELFEALGWEDMELLACLYRFVQRYGLTVEEVMWSFTRYVEWVERTDAWHMRDCDDEECECACCVRYREVLREREERHREERRERFREQVQRPQRLFRSRLRFRKFWSR